MVDGLDLDPSFAGGDSLDGRADGLAEQHPHRASSRQPVKGFSSPEHRVGPARDGDVGNLRLASEALGNLSGAGGAGDPIGIAMDDHDRCAARPGGQVGRVDPRC